MRCILLAFLIIFLSGCATQNIANKSKSQQSPEELLEFAKTNCFFLYFKKKGYDLKDIGSISGGIVEMGSYSADRYQQVSLLVQNYSPSIRTKQNIDIDLLKCFQLDKDPNFIQSIDKLK